MKLKPRIKLITILTCALLLIGTTAYAVNVTIQWTHSTPSVVDGYNIYYGNTAGTYNAPIDVGNVMTTTIDVPTGVHFFTVTAYNQYGESGYAPEVGPVGVLSAPMTVIVGFGP